MTNKVKMTMWFDPDTAALIEANSTPRGKADFVAACVKSAIRSERDGDGALERLAAAVERATLAMEKGGKQ